MQGLQPLAEDHTYNVAGNYTLLPGVREMLESLGPVRAMPWG